MLDARAMPTPTPMNERRLRQAGAATASTGAGWFKYATGSGRPWTWSAGGGGVMASYLSVLGGCAGAWWHSPERGRRGGAARLATQPTRVVRHRAG